MPLMMAIPYFSKNDRIAQLASGKASALTNGVDSGQSPWDKFHFIKPFAEAIRDRLTMYFDVTGNMRKPKMIAVTGCTVGAGASTIAAGLAASLSEIGEGKVLLVDMSGSQGTAHPFYEGAPALSLSKAMHLPPANTYQGSAVPENNLFVVRTESPASGTNCVGLRRMMPELKASEFDFIVFDLPPLGQTRPTALIAGMMDKVLLVVEAEANTRSEVKRGYYDLVDASADIAMIFNKAKQHGPKALVGSSL